MKATPADIDRAYDHFREMLGIRRSSRLFRLPTAADVQSRLHFWNTGPGQLPGLIVETLADADGSIDRADREVVVLWNAGKSAVSFPAPGLAGQALRLHPIQKASSDPVVRTSSFDAATGTFTVPARTTAVFLGRRPVKDQIALLTADVGKLLAQGALDAGQANALTAKLANAQAQLDKGNATPAANQLAAFGNQVAAFVQSGVLAHNAGDALAGALGDILEALQG